MRTSRARTKAKRSTSTVSRVKARQLRLQVTGVRWVEAPVASAAGAGDAAAVVAARVEALAEAGRKSRA